MISQADYYPKDGDQLWCVNPSFEYWYLLHFEKRSGYLRDCDSVINVLKSRGYLENYEKSADVFDELLPCWQENLVYRKS
ncbi:MAG: RloB family protein [Lachnospiraceae bacterium]|nr:RloB family protein [Lachnospiraceae bacterium]